ncbi:MAG: hypothetical protein MI924_15430 [Chloroflexales bacterium]|nr:hypothetical protein [Chloroflexales bacterium]
MQTGQTTTAMAAVEFAQLAEMGLRRELVARAVCETMPPGGVHGAIAGRMPLL